MKHLNNSKHKSETENKVTIKLAPVILGLSDIVGNILKQLGGLTLLNRTNAQCNNCYGYYDTDDSRIGTNKLCCDEKDIRIMHKCNVPFFAFFFFF